MCVCVCVCVCVHVCVFVYNVWGMTVCVARKRAREYVLLMCMRVCLSILFLNSLLSIKPIIPEVKCMYFIKHII